MIRISDYVLLQRYVRRPVKRNGTFMKCVSINRHIRCILVILLAFCLSACSDIGQIQNNDSVEAITDHESIETSTPGSFASISEMFSALDSNYSSGSELYMEAIHAYEEQINSAKADEISESYGNTGKLRVSFGYVDEDTLPELFIATDTTHVFGVNVFTYDSEIKEVVRIGEFSSFGSMSYVEQKNRIISSYGSNGFYMDMFSAIEQNKSVLVGSVAEYMNLAELYFARYPIPEGADGSNKDSYGGLTDGTGPNAAEVNFPDPRDVTYIVSKDEHDQIVSVYENFPDEGEVKTVDYDDMYEVNFK